MGVTVVLGTQWGDEGKGKITDTIAADADVVVRFNGGANAGHTIIAEGKRFAFNLVPAGVVRKGTQNLIAPGVVVDPEVLVKEIRGAEEFAGKVAILVSARAHVVMPFHKILDAYEEEARGPGGGVGTTLRGVGPAYRDKAARHGVRMSDFVDPDVLPAAVEEAARRAAAYLPPERRGQVDPQAVLAAMAPLAEAIRPYVGDTEEALWAASDAGQHIVLEGAQGTMLDLDFGTYPYVTSSNTTAGAAAALSALPPRAIERVVGVTKAYTTRVGSGPFPTELINEAEAEALRQAGGEFGTTTGRPRRCGWLDLVVLRYAARLSGITEIALTKLDVLQGMSPLKVCVAYKLDGKVVSAFPARASSLGPERCQPQYKEVDPIPVTDWKALAARGATIRELPKPAVAYVRLVEEIAGCPVTMVGVGPARADIIWRRVRAVG
ncbi:MAG TPA: adenylosuccinate synthase [Candidatus Thermoplasmatota archaeon]